MHVAVPQYILLAQAAVLLVTSVLLIYPVVAYARNVAYTEGFVFLALSFFSVTAVGVLDFVLDTTTAANLVRLVGAVLALIGVWFFARDFIRISHDSERYGDFGGHSDLFGGGPDE